MRREYSKQLKSEFLSLLKSIDDRFESFKGRSEWLSASEYAYVAKVDGVWLFIVAITNPKGLQNFTIEFGWSRLNRYPEVLSSKFLDTEPNPARFKEAEYLTRISLFLGNDTWWFLEDKSDFGKHFDDHEISDDQALTRVRKALAEIKPTLTSGVLPFFQDLQAVS